MVPAETRVDEQRTCPLPTFTWAKRPMSANIYAPQKSNKGHPIPLTRACHRQVLLKAALCAKLLSGALTQRELLPEPIRSDIPDSSFLWIFGSSTIASNRFHRDQCEPLLRKLFTNAVAARRIWRQICGISICHIRRSVAEVVILNRQASARK
jgi:hypothetical protein